jgi:hypothetical protein
VILFNAYMILQKRRWEKQWKEAQFGKDIRKDSLKVASRTIRSSSLVIDMHQQTIMNSETHERVSDAFLDKTESFLGLSKSGIIFDMYQFIISLLSCAHYIWWTILIYNPTLAKQTVTTLFRGGYGSCTMHPSITFYYKMQNFFTCNFLLDFMLHFYASRSRTSFLLKITSLIDILVLIPICPLLFQRLYCSLDGTIQKNFNVLDTCVNIIHFLFHRF